MIINITTGTNRGMESTSMQVVNMTAQSMGTRTPTLKRRQSLTAR